MKLEQALGLVVSSSSAHKDEKDDDKEEEDDEERLLWVAFSNRGREPHLSRTKPKNGGEEKSTNTGRLS